MHMRIFIRQAANLRLLSASRVNQHTVVTLTEKDELQRLFYPPVQINNRCAKVSVEILFCQCHVCVSVISDVDPLVCGNREYVTYLFTIPFSFPMNLHSKPEHVICQRAL